MVVSCRAYIAPPLPPSGFPFAVDSLRTQVVRPGVVHRFIYSSAGPWAIHVLDVDRSRCWAARAVKAGGAAIGREKTSGILAQAARRENVAGGINADFFLFAPPGLPMGAFITRGRVVAGPGDQVVLAFDSAGAPLITTLRTSGQVSIGRGSYAIASWNRATTSGLAFFDAAFGPATDTSSGTVELVVRRLGGGTYIVVATDTAPAGTAIPLDGGVLVAGRSASSALHRTLLALHPGDTVHAVRALTPIHPLEAVGGRPQLLRDSVVVAAVDTAGQPGSATSRHPRTAVGIASGGRRLVLVVVDGRQKPYSDGMTLRELATLMLALGARDAINLDGGGSSTLVYADPESRHRLRIANRPSDAEGERPVGNALAIVKQCFAR